MKAILILWEDTPLPFCTFFLDSLMAGLCKTTGKNGGRWTASVNLWHKSRTRPFDRQESWTLDAVDCMHRRSELDLIRYKSGTKTEDSLRLDVVINHMKHLINRVSRAVTALNVS